MGYIDVYVIRKLWAYVRLFTVHSVSWGLPGVVAM